MEYDQLEMRLQPGAVRFIELKLGQDAEQSQGADQLETAAEPTRHRPNDRGLTVYPVQFA